MRTRLSIMQNILRINYEKGRWAAMDVMEIATLATMIMFAVIISSFLSHFLPKISTPLVQIALGIAWYFTPALPNIQLEPDLFMLFFIVPLFYLESRNIDREALAKDLGLSMSLAVGLVLLTMVMSGVTLHAIWPAIPMVAAIALGAIISPTDAVSVAQLGGVVKLSPRQRSVLQSESLLNDPVSLVGFQTVLVALATGNFSPASFSEQVVISFILGTAIGAAIGLVFDQLVLLLRKRGLESTTTRILMELFLPFGTYLMAEHVGISGLLAVVACGVVLTFHRKGVGGDVARTNLVSNSVWQFLDFTLNGTVFVMLGIQLPMAMHQILTDGNVSLWLLVGAVVALTVVTLLLRFVWCAVMLRVAKDKVTGKRRKMTPERWHSAVVMTFGGPKGAISLAMAFSLPYAIDDGSSVPVRNAILFVVSAYILISILMSNLMLPVLSPKPEDSSYEVWAQRDIEMLRRTITKIVDYDTPETHAAVGQVLKSYNERIDRVQTDVPSSSPREQNELRIRTLMWERDWLREQINSRNSLMATDDETRMQLEGARAILDHVEEVLARLDDDINGRGHGLGFRIARLRRWLMPLIRRVWTGIARRTPGLSARHSMAIRKVQIPLYAYVIERLTKELQNGDDHNAELISGMLIEYRRALSMLRGAHNTFFNTVTPVDSEQLERVRSEALRMELDTIREMLENEEITRDDAQIMRMNVHLMQAESAMV